MLVRKWMKSTEEDYGAVDIFLLFRVFIPLVKMLLTVFSLTRQLNFIYLLKSISVAVFKLWAFSLFVLFAIHFFIKVFRLGSMNKSILSSRKIQNNLYWQEDHIADARCFNISIFSKRGLLYLVNDLNR